MNTEQQIDCSCQIPKDGNAITYFSPWEERTRVWSMNIFINFYKYGIIRHVTNSIDYVGLDEDAEKFATT